MRAEDQLHDFKNNSVLRIEESIERIVKCVKILNKEEIWERPNGSSNSIGNLIIHLNGNITQYILSSLGGIDDNRERDQEFRTDVNPKSEIILEGLRSTISDSIDIIRDLSEEEFLKTRSVQGFELSGQGIIIHVVEHLSYHTGQIAFWTKALKNKDLGFYAGLDLNKKNED